MAPRAWTRIALRAWATRVERKEVIRTENVAMVTKEKVRMARGMIGDGKVGNNSGGAAGAAVVSG